MATLYTLKMHIYQGELLANDVPAVKVMALAGHYSIDTTLASYVNRSALEGSRFRKPQVRLTPGAPRYLLLKQMLN